MDNSTETCGASAPSVSSPIVQMWASIAGLLVLIYIWVRSVDYVQRRHLPPGPRGWPLIGSLHLLSGKHPHQTLWQLAQKFGPLMYLKLGSVPTVVVSSPELTEEFLKTQDQIFAHRPPNLLGEVFFYNHQDILTSDPGPLWRALRKLCAVELFSPKRLATFRDVRRSAILETLGRILSEGNEGKLVNLTKRTSETTFNNITQMLFSRSYYGLKTRTYNEHGQLKEFQDLNEEWNVAAGSFNVSDFIPWLRKLDIGGVEATYWGLRKDFDDFLSLVLEEHRDKDTRDANATRDVTDLCIEMQKNDATKSEDQKVWSEEVVKAFLQVMLIGGTDTSAGQMIWMLSEIMKHPEIKHTIVEELDTVIGRERLVLEEADLEKLPYFQAAVREAFRLWPVAPLLIPHYSSETTKVTGYTIPKHTRVIVNCYGIQRDARVWGKNPDVFDPSRFLNNPQPVDVRGSDYRIFPFGAGRRVCPGVNLALILVPLCVAQILHACDLSLPEGMKPEDINFDSIFGAATHKRVPLEVRLSPRLPLHVYTAAGIDV